MDYRINNKTPKLLFAAGASLLAYNTLGHTLAAIAWANGERGVAAWTRWSPAFYPTFSTIAHYHTHWAVLHAAMLVLMGVGFVLACKNKKDRQ